MPEDLSTHPTISTPNDERTPPLVIESRINPTFEHTLDFEMIEENELPVLMESTEETTNRFSKSREIILHRAVEDTIVEDMCVDDEAKQSTIILYIEYELSTPELPSGTSLEEQFPTLIPNNLIGSMGSESTGPYDKQFISVEPTQVLENTTTEPNMSERADDTTREEHPFALLASNVIDPTVFINQELSHELQPTEESTITNLD